ncbi:beta-N-acetylhexosaminidase [Aggregatilinea lenta]|uniref:beta-N-acetylhexosaminidase n=1 Tax=Aggregatilinea lenta TaxID=913108 RepID=UPI000E5BD2B2|nr:beta-N-acetylhexosaminidase [Aggregatilinea lenta]
MPSTLEEKIGQMLVVGFQGLEPPGYIPDWLAKGRIGGVILFARNVATPVQLAQLVQTCHDAASQPCLVAIDQEGGVVARLRDGFTESPGAMALGAADLETLAENVSSVLATEMRALGINWNLAPALDITHNIHNPSVGTRSLGIDPERIARLGAAQVRGFQHAGVAATAKHFPGKADTPVDPHVSLPVIEGELDTMWDTDLVPFRAVSQAGIASMLITHAQFKSIDAQPSTLSPKIIEGLLRRDMGFEGLVVTDCMEMKAVTNAYGPGESAVLAALAGANIILFSHTREYQEAAHDALLEAARSGRLPEEKIDFSLSKIQAMKARFAVTDNRPSMDVIRCSDHLAVMEEAARAGIVLVHDDQHNLPLNGAVGVVEFASALESLVLESGGRTGFVSLLASVVPGVQSVSLDAANPAESASAKAQTLASQTGVLVIATRNAHLNPAQRAVAQTLIATGQRTILVCLRNPYDAGVLEGAGTILLTCGDSAPSLQAAVDALQGRFVPTGKLPVSLMV